MPQSVRCRYIDHTVSSDLLGLVVYVGCDHRLPYMLLIPIYEKEYGLFVNNGLIVKDSSAGQTPGNF